MSENNKPSVHPVAIMVMIIGAVVVFFAVGIASYNSAEQDWRVECVRREVGEWKIDDHGEIVFEWKGPRVVEQTTTITVDENGNEIGRNVNLPDGTWTFYLGGTK